MKALPHTRSCFVCGESNAVGLHLRFESDGSIVRTRFTPKPEHVGFKQVVHGGILATLLDEIMVWACAVRTKRFAVCAELNVRFLNPVRPGEEILAIAQWVASRREKIFEAKAALSKANGEVLATATGKYWPIKKAELAAMGEEIVGDPWCLDGSSAGPRPGA